MAAGLVIISTLDRDLDYWVMAVGLVIFGAGAGLAGTPATTAITASLPQSKQGVASAVNDTARELGSAIGIAVLGSAITATYTDRIQAAIQGLPPQVTDALESSVAASQSAQLDQLGARGQQVAAAAQQAFVDGVGQAMVIAAVVVGVAALLLLVLAPGVERRRERERQGAAS